MPTPTLNAPGVRRVLEGGREFLVAPMSLINPGVLPGSKGPLYYSPEDTAAATPDWERIPITVGHPVDNAGRHVSASVPGILDRVGIGEVRAPKFDSKLRAEGWFDVQRTDAVDPRITERLRRNQPIPLSTGLFTENKLVTASSCPRTGIQYNLAAKNHVPDHLAILLDQRGACHLEHGCGVLINEEGGLVVNSAGEPIAYDWVVNLGSDSSQTSATCVCGGSCEKCKTTLDSLLGKSGPAPSANATLMGRPLVEEEKCPKCGARLDEDGMCPNCGYQRGATMNARGSGWVGAVKKAFGDYISQADEDSAGGLRVWVNPKAQRVLIDVMDWGDAKLARATVGRAAAVLGESSVHWQNEGGEPEGDGWTELDPPTVNQMNGYFSKLLPAVREMLSNAFSLLTNALPNQPRSLVSGKYKVPNAGTGKGEVHSAAQEGFLNVTAEDEELGADALYQKTAFGENPPNWSVDESLWEKSKKHASESGKYGGEDSSKYWAVVTAIYKKMGGTIKGKKETTENAEEVLPARCEGVEDHSEPLSSFLLTNAELGSDSQFDSDDLRAAAFGRMLEVGASRGAAEQSTVTRNVAGDQQSGEHAKASTLHLEAAETHLKAGLSHLADEHFKIAAEHESRSKALAHLARNEETPSTPLESVENTHPTNGDTDVARKDNIDFLTANCSCWKGEGDRAILEKFSDAKLETLASNARAAAENEVVANAAKEGFRHEGVGYKWDGARNSFVTNAPFVKGGRNPNVDKRVPPDDPEEVIEGEGTEGSEEMDAQAAGKPAVPSTDPNAPPYKKKRPMEPMMNKQNESGSQGPQTVEQWLAANNAPPEIVATLNFAKGVEQQAREALLGRILTANASTEEGRKKIRPFYERASLQELQGIVAQLPAPVQNTGYPTMNGNFAPAPYGPGNAGGFAPAGYGAGPAFGFPAQSPAPNYVGAAAPAPTANSGSDAEDADFLPIPTVNWEEGCSPALAKRLSS